MVHVNKYPVPLGQGGLFWFRIYLMVRSVGSSYFRDICSCDIIGCMKIEKKFDVVGIGSPLLDFIVNVSDDILKQVDLVKGEMHLIGKERSNTILEELKDYKVTIAPGGSSANTLSGVSALGGDAVFIGKIGMDNHGAIYEQKTSDDGVLTRLTSHSDVATGHAITFITPDGERTFATHLGASVHFRKGDVFEDDIELSKILHIEGYQLEDKDLKESMVHAMEVAKKSGTKVSIDLSDPALVGRNLKPIRELVKEYVDIVFVNELEAEAFTGKQDEEALHDIYELCDVAVVKLGAGGSLVKALDKVYTISPHKVVVKNTNGAGDMYAGAFLYAITHNIDYEKAGKIASFASAQVVAGESARLEPDLKKLVKSYIIEVINS